MAKGRKTGGGSRKGVPNKTTADVRAAIAKLLEGVADELPAWLKKVSKKDPARALDIVTRMAEYHIPKLARTELTGPQGGPVQILRKYFGTQPPAAK